MGQSTYTPPGNSWKKIGTYTYTDFSTSGGTISIPSGYDIPFGAVVTGFVIYVSIPFTGDSLPGTSFDSYVINPDIGGKGISLDADGTISDFYYTDPFLAVAKVKLTLTINVSCTGGDLDQATSGSIDLFINVTAPLEGPPPS